MDGGGHHLGRQASGGPLLRLDGIRPQFKHAVQVEGLGVLLYGGSRRPSPCSRCQKTDRMARLPDTPTDFGGQVNVWVCRRCGIVAILTHRERPGSSGI